MAFAKVVSIMMAMVPLAQSICDLPESMKPPFTDAMCGGKGGRDSPLFRSFSNQMQSDVEDADEDWISTIRSCVSDDYNVDLCDDCEGSIAEEMVLDNSFLEMFEELSTDQDTVELDCVDDYTLHYSVDITGKLKAIPVPITYEMDMNVKFNENGEVTKIEDFTAFQREIAEIFHDLMDGNKGGKGIIGGRRPKSAADDVDMDMDDEEGEDEDGEHGDEYLAAAPLDVNQPQKVYEVRTAGYETNLIFMVSMASVIVIGVIIGVCTGAWISGYGWSKRAPVELYEKVNPPIL